MGVVENMKDFADLVKRIGDIELNRKILTLETGLKDSGRLRPSFHEAPLFPCLFSAFGVPQ
jgi:hypothetical protein